ncbi:MAG: hypothetical protein ACXVJG_10705 [Mucilaginibacter sp.]
MRSIIKILLLFVIPIQSFAQDTVKLKHQAQAVANALLKSDYATVVNHTYPKIVTASGGKAQMLHMLKTGMQQMQAQGITLESATIGSPGKFYKAGAEIHCLVPETVVLKSDRGRLVNHANLLAISKNGGNMWYFLDINQNTYKQIPKLFPNFNKKLVIPEPGQSGMQ